MCLYNLPPGLEQLNNLALYIGQGSSIAQFERPKLDSQAKVQKLDLQAKVQKLDLQA